MKETCILMSTPMIHAMEREIDPKSETRRVAKLYPSIDGKKFAVYPPERIIELTKGEFQRGVCHYESTGAISGPYKIPYKPGDILLIKEAAWMWCERVPNGVTPTGRPKWHYVPERSKTVFYVADHQHKPEIRFVSPDTGNEWGWRFKVGRFLPRWAIRIRREVTNIRVERLQDISEADAKAEGVEYDHSEIDFIYWVDDYFGKTRTTESAVACYKLLWESINGAGSWDANPYVWCISFKRIES